MKKHEALGTTTVSPARRREVEEQVRHAYLVSDAENEIAAAIMAAGVVIALAIISRD